MPASPPASQAPAGPDLAGLAAGLGLDEAEFQATLGDPIWRLCNIYTIRSEEGKPIRFEPNEEQMEVVREIYEHGARILILIKARQLGMSTLLCIIALDTIMWGTSVEACLIDFNSINAKKKLREKIIYAWDRLHPLIKDQFTVYAKSLQKGEFSIGPANAQPSPDDPEAKPYSTYMAGETPRGGTFQFSHYSEWWEIAARFPQRSSDILTAGWPAGEQGVRVIETTVHGGKHGEAWQITKQGLDKQDNILPRSQRTEQTPVVMFFPWWKKKAYRVNGSASLIRPETHAYFADLEKQVPHKFDDAQKLWYQGQADTLGHFVLGQYPATLRECFQAPIKGAIWAEALAKAKTAGRIGEFPHNEALEVDTFWDLGAPDNTATLYCQHDRQTRRLIDFDGGLNLDLPDRIRHMVTKGYRFGTHYLPHDGSARQKNGVSFQREFMDELKRQGVSGRVVVLPRCTTEWTGINHANLLLSTVVEIDEKKCEKFLEAASLFRRKPDPTSNDPENPVFLSEVLSDWTNHAADTFRYLAESALQGHLPHTSNGIMANLYFDPTRLQAAQASLPEHPPTLMALDRAGTTWVHVAARHDVGGWLRVWETPLQGPRYIVAVLNGAVAVWRAAGWDRNASAERPARMVAACVDEAGINQDKLLSWASMASTYYGMVPVVADVVSIPGAVEKLREQGVGVAARQQSLAERRVGQATAIRKPGHEFGPEERQQAYAVLQELWRDGAVEVFCPSVLRQMGGIIATEQGGFEVLSGYAQHWLDAAALGVWTLGLAAPAMQAGRLAPEHTGGGYRGDSEENSGLPFERQRRKLF